MASISRAADGTRRILFTASDGRRRCIHLGKVNGRVAGEIKLRVEHLVVAATTHTSMDGETARWTAGIGDDLADRLAVLGLIPPRSPAAATTLATFLDDYISSRTDVQPSTVINMQAARRRLVEFFGKDKKLTDITPGDADAWLPWLKERHAGATVGRTVRRARQFFRHAVRRRLLTENPFADVKAPSEVNEARAFFITRDITEKVLEACPSAEWRLLFALSRFGGLRCPSEHLALKWTDMDWAQNRFRVDSPKTGPRWVPLFPELRPYLDEAFTLAEEGAVYVITRSRDSKVNLRTQLQRIICSAGLEPWERLWHNLRATRETELAGEYPIHVVARWLGHTTMVAQKHYLQVTDADFERAAKYGAGATHNPTQIPTQQGAEMGRKGSQAQSGGSEKPLLFQALRDDASTCEIPQCTNAPRPGLEPGTY